MGDKSTVKIELNGAGVGSAKVDDLDISSSVMRLSLDAAAGRGTTLVLHMLPGLLSAEVDATAVRVDADTAMALMALGWSPPDMNVVTPYFARLVLAATGSWDSSSEMAAQCAAAEEAIQSLKSRRPAELEPAAEEALKAAALASTARMPIVVGETGPVWMQFVLTWHPLNGAPPVEVPLGQHWVFPVESCGEFRLSTREVPPPAADTPEGGAPCPC